MYSLSLSIEPCYFVDTLLSLSEFRILKCFFFFFPSFNWQLDNQWRCSHSMECSSAIKMNELSIRAMIRMNLGGAFYMNNN